jgi:hypothetical protein
MPARRNRGKPPASKAGVLIPKDSLWTNLDEMLGQGMIAKADYNSKTRWGDKHRGLVYEGVKIEIFTADEDNWGYQLWLRTGPAEGGETFMKAINSRSNLRAIDGYLWHGTKWQRNEKDKWDSSDRRKLSIPDEAAFFNLIGIEPVSPSWRSPAMYQKLWNNNHQWGDATLYIKRYSRPDRYDNSRYGMLSKLSTQRQEYEEMTPVMWKHRLLPYVIADLEKRLKTDDQYRLLLAHKERLKEGEEAIRNGTMRQ